MTGIPSLRLRPAVITNYDAVTQKITFTMTDNIESRKYNAFAPHPLSSSGWGILAGPTIGTRIMVAPAGINRYAPVCTVPMNAYSALDFGGTTDISNVSVSEKRYPTVNPGEVVLQSLSGAQVKLVDSGIKIKTDKVCTEYNAKWSSILEYAENKYQNTEAGRQISGIIKRDKRDAIKDIELNADRLTSLSYESELSIIGRDPNSKPSKLTVKLPAGGGAASNNTSFRNPALTEHRTLIYECALSDMVDDKDKELERLNPDISPSFLYQTSRRDMQRSDVLNLGMHLPNLLYENIIGTTVDIYGNVLDINRNKINFNANGESADGAASQQSIQAPLDSTLSLLRRSIKYHFELNSRKVNQFAVPPALDSLSNYYGGESDEATATGYSHSRFFIDVDGEGLTKINVPASSNTGNIPILSRYINSFDESSEESRNNGAFKDPSKIDIQHFAFGVGDGIVLDSSYTPADIISNSTITYKTAYHDILSTASEADLGDVLAANLFNDVTTAAPNAGGRSVHANLDGSMELNVGRDVADKKSIVIDTAGSIVSRIGMDKNKHSIISQADGNVYIQIGGDAPPGDALNESPTFKIFVKVKSAENSTEGFHTITFDSAGIRIESAPDTDMEFRSAGKLKLIAQGQAVLSGSSVAFFGEDGQRLLLPTGTEIRG